MSATTAREQDRRRKVASVVKTVTITELTHYGNKVALEHGTWPTCGHCLALEPLTGILKRKPVDAVELVDRNRTTAVILGKCHGAAQALRVDFEGPYQDEDMAFAWRSLAFFRTEVGR
jgi:hypothetical protein